jgi:hypothetical protein
VPFEFDPSQLKNQLLSASSASASAASSSASSALSPAASGSKPGAAAGSATAGSGVPAPPASSTTIDIHANAKTPFSDTHTRRRSISNHPLPSPPAVLIHEPSAAAAAAAAASASAASDASSSGGRSRRLSGTTEPITISHKAAAGGAGPVGPPRPPKPGTTPTSTSSSHLLAPTDSSSKRTAAGAGGAVGVGAGHGRSVSSGAVPSGLPDLGEDDQGTVIHGATTSTAASLFADDDKHHFNTEDVPPLASPVLRPSHPALLTHVLLLRVAHHRFVTHSCVCGYLCSRTTRAL